MTYATKSAVCSEKLTVLKTKRSPLNIRNQSVPRCKHFPPRLVDDVFNKVRCLFWEINLSKDQKQSALYKESVRTAL